MEGYRVISSKKVTLSDIQDEQEQNEDTLFKLENNGIEVVEESYSPTHNEVFEISFSTYEDNSLEVFDNLAHNDSNAPVHQNPLNNNYLGFETAEFDQNNSMQLGKPSTSDELSLNQNNQIQNEDLENCSEYFTIDFIESPNESNSAFDFPDVDQNTEMHSGSETDDASESGDSPAIGRSGGKAPKQWSFEKFASYICPQCGVDCGPYVKWKLHIETKHGFGSLEAANVQSIVNKHGELCLKCRDCPKMFKSTQGFSSLILHRITHLPFKTFVACSICSAKYRSKTNLKQHLKREHKVLYVNTMPVLQDSALEHIRLFCPLCKEEQKNIIDWRAHMKEQHDYYNKARSKFEPAGNNIYNCSVCKMKVRENNLVEHIQRHEDFKPFHCTYCRYSTSQFKLAVCHVRSKHLRKELLWRCTFCKATFKSTNERKEHYILQHKVVYQTCKVCKKSFNSSSSLLSHINSTNHHTLK